MALDRSVIALSRFGLGPRPGDTNKIAADPHGALMAELTPDFVVMSNPVLEDTAAALAELKELQMMKQAARAAAPPAASPAAGTGAATTAGPAIADAKRRARTARPPRRST